TSSDSLKPIRSPDNGPAWNGEGQGRTREGSPFFFGPSARQCLGAAAWEGKCHGTPPKVPRRWRASETRSSRRLPSQQQDGDVVLQFLRFGEGFDGGAGGFGAGVEGEVVLKAADNGFEVIDTEHGLVLGLAGFGDAVGVEDEGLAGGEGEAHVAEVEIAV